MKTKTLAEKLDCFLQDENEEVVLEKLQNFQADSIWFDQHYEDLKKKYKEEWVAVFNKQVIDHGKNLKALLRRLSKNYPHDSGDVVVEFVTLEEVNLIL
jgi:hypothetical protein